MGIMKAEAERPSVLEKRAYKGNGTLKCGACGSPLVEHGPPPCPLMIWPFTVGNPLHAKKR